MKDIYYKREHEFTNNAHSVEERSDFLFLLHVSTELDGKTHNFRVVDMSDIVHWQHSCSYMMH